jgi:hypothetical protein
MSTTPTRKLITSALALSMGIATAASATDTNSLPVLAVVTVTPDTTYTASADHQRLPLMPLVTVTPDTNPVATNHSSTLPRERIADHASLRVSIDPAINAITRDRLREEVSNRGSTREAKNRAGQPPLHAKDPTTEKRLRVGRENAKPCGHRDMMSKVPTECDQADCRIMSAQFCDNIA